MWALKRLHEKNWRVSLPVKEISSSTKISLNSCSHSRISEHNGSPCSLLDSLLFVFGIDWIDSQRVAPISRQHQLPLALERYHFQFDPLVLESHYRLMLLSAAKSLCNLGSLANLALFVFWEASINTVLARHHFSRKFLMKWFMGNACRSFFVHQIYSKFLLPFWQITHWASLCSIDVSCFSFCVLGFLGIPHLVSCVHCEFVRMLDLV